MTDTVELDTVIEIGEQNETKIPLQAQNNEFPESTVRPTGDVIVDKESHIVITIEEAADYVSPIDKKALQNVDKYTKKVPYDNRYTQQPRQDNRYQTQYSSQPVSQGKYSGGYAQPQQTQYRYADKQREREPESEEYIVVQFQDDEDRRDFVIKVFGILLAQLLFSIGFLLCVLYILDLRIFVARNGITIMVMTVLYLILMIAILCYEPLRRIFPLNIILLCCLTITLTYIMGYVCSRYENYIIFEALGMTTGVVAIIMLLAIFLPFDITQFIWYFIILGMVVFMAIMVLTLVTLFIRSQAVNMAIAGIIAVFYSLYIWFQVQLIMGGGKYSLSPDDYVYGAVILYISIINLFLAILELLGGSN